MSKTERLDLRLTSEQKSTIERAASIEGTTVLLKDALLKAITAARMIGVRALLVHAVDDEAGAFYHRYGFRPLLSANPTLFFPLDQLKI